MYKKLAVFTAIILVSSFISAYTFTDNAKADPTYKYLGYGDSNMMGNNCDVVAGYNTVENMQIYNDPASTSFGTGQGGQESDWGLSNYDSYVKGQGNYIFEEFGVNDLAHDGTATHMRDNKWAMYAKAYSYGEEEHYFPCINQLIDPAYTGTPWNRAWSESWTNTQVIVYERAYFNVTMDYFKSKSVDYIPLFDAIDSIPFNGRADDYDTRYSCGGGHYNMDGLSRISNFTWRFVTGDIYNVTWNAGGNSYSVTCNYNYTIHMNLPAGWSYDNITVLCTTNSTEIGFTEAKKIDGTDTFYIQGVNGSSYTVTNQDITVTEVNGKSSGSIVYDGTPTINWTVVSGASHYQLQIDDNSDFSSPEVNISEINQWTYPSNCIIANSVVSFTLSTANKISKGFYYVRVRAYI